MQIIDLTKEGTHCYSHKFIFNSDGESVDYEEGSELLYLILDGDTVAVWVSDIPLVVEALQRVQTLAKGN